MKLVTTYGPPGTGKTQSLIDTASEETAGCVFLSYTKAAAEEAASRIEHPHVRASTLHSLAYGAARLTRSSVVDRPKLHDFGREIGVMFKGMDDNTWDEEQEGDQYLSVISYARNRLLTDYDKAYVDMGCPGTRDMFHSFALGYKNWKETYGYMDFDDMLFAAITMPDTRLPVLPVIFLDEAQDCSPLQWRLMDRLAARATRVYVAGDDDQAIFEWNGADPHGMRNFNDRWKGKQTVLTKSHRVPKCVHDFVHAYILDEIKQRVKKDFKARAATGIVVRCGDFRATIGEVAGTGQRGGWPGQTTVLVRDRFQMLEVQRDLNAEMIPYRMTGGNQSPWESKYAQALRGDERALRTLGVKDRDGVLAKVPHYLYHFYSSMEPDAPIHVTLSTIHGAKGREAENVVVDLTLSNRTEEGIFINRDAELRVMYVALTRTKNRLVLCSHNSLL